MVFTLYTDVLWAFYVKSNDFVSVLYLKLVLYLIMMKIWKQFPAFSFRQSALQRKELKFIWVWNYEVQSLCKLDLLFFLKYFFSKFRILTTYLSNVVFTKFSCGNRSDKIALGKSFHQFTTSEEKKTFRRKCCN